MIIIIPLGGLGVRFKNLNYKLPKPLINVLGKPILFWLLDNLNITNSINMIIIPYNNELSKYNFESLLKSKYPLLNFIFLKLASNTRGAAETLLTGLNYLVQNNITEQPIISLDGDNFYLTDILKIWDGTNTVFSFIDNNNDPIYSYIKIENDNIIDIVEKVKVSNMANTGAYAFNSWLKLKLYIEKVIHENIVQHNEFYISNVIKLMLADKIKFFYKIIEKDSYISLGTPLSVRLFANNYPVISAINNKRLIESKNILFNIENILFDNNYCPNFNNINYLNYLKKVGNKIILNSSFSLNHSINNNNYGNFIFSLLNKNSILYDEIYFNQISTPIDFYIDDKNYIFDNLDKEPGFYESIIKPRDFNSLQSSSIELFKKESFDLSGEIHFYLNIPKTIKDMFPLMIDYDTDKYKWYKMERINGIPISKLFINSELTPCILDNIMNSIHRIHNTINTFDITLYQNINIYANYKNKIIKRYDTYREVYNDLPNSDIYLQKIITKLEDYTDNKLGKIGVIHGDCVFTNIIINNFNKLKFIDMRGQIDEQLSIFGDVFYDWAKLYQSLIGYDEILENKVLISDYKDNLIKFYEEKITSLFDKEYLTYIKIITASLLFSLIPLHKNDANKCTEYYNIMQKLIDSFF